MSVTVLTELSRYYGNRSDYVIAGGGNTSFKDESTLYIKGSGASLADIGEEDFVRMDRRLLARIWEKTYPEDGDERETAVLADMMAARRPGEERKRPSVETLLHDMLPFNFVVHTHPALVNGLTCSREGAAAAESLFAGEALWIESTNPGYILSLAVKNAMEAYRRRKGRPAQLILLQNHGIFVGADTAEGIKAAYGGVMGKLAARAPGGPDFSGETAEWENSAELEKVLRELAAGPGGGAVTVFRRNRAFAALTAGRAAFYPVSSAFTPDHIVYAGSDPLFVETGSPPEAAAALRAAWRDFTAAYGRIPKTAAVQGLGIFGIGPTEKAARLALELFTDAVKVAYYAASFGGVRFMTQDQIDFINNWEVERYRANISGK
ncbi:MAG: class II aldolase/adducin family protein [Treponema sp.]|jgi:rhamnose utilization protein RhaD (predicted bifunctional aldolase and dehydrogenase)|nr:class II aldolase/adducin family protein [Treponema sp.]